MSFISWRRLELNQDQKIQGKTWAKPRKKMFWTINQRPYIIIFASHKLKSNSSEAYTNSMKMDCQISSYSLVPVMHASAGIAKDTVLCTWWLITASNLYLWVLSRSSNSNVKRKQKTSCRKCYTPTYATLTYKIKNKKFWTINQRPYIIILSVTILSSTVQKHTQTQ